MRPTAPPAMLAAIACTALILAVAPPQARAQEAQTWAELQGALFPGADIAAADAMIAIDAPTRGTDPTAVPFGVTITPPMGAAVEHVTIIVEENPAPVAAEIEVGPGMGRTVDLSTMLRIDAYSNVRVVARLDDGSLHQAAAFIKASGGCSAPSLGDQQLAASTAGQMTLRAIGAPVARADLRISHPNNSGFQVDQLTLLHIPPWFVDDIEVLRGDTLVMRVRGGISLSQDPELRFAYDAGEPGDFTVRVEDTRGGVFQSRFPAAGS